MRRAVRPPIFYGLAVLFGLFVVFLYGPIATVVVLAFQGPEGGLVFPMNGVSLHWFGELFRPQSIGDIWGAFDRSIALGAIVMAVTIIGGQVLCLLLTLLVTPVVYSCFDDLREWKPLTALRRLMSRNRTPRPAEV